MTAARRMRASAAAPAPAVTLLPAAVPAVPADPPKPLLGLGGGSEDTYLTLYLTRLRAEALATLATALPEANDLACIVDHNGMQIVFVAPRGALVAAQHAALYTAGSTLAANGFETTLAFCVLTPDTHRTQPRLCVGGRPNLARETAAAVAAGAHASS